jgi:hypothetical protein
VLLLFLYFAVCAYSVVVSVVVHKGMSNDIWFQSSVHWHGTMEVVILPWTNKRKRGKRSSDRKLDTHVHSWGDAKRQDIVRTGIPKRIVCSFVVVDDRENLQRGNATAFAVLVF